MSAMPEPAESAVPAPAADAAPVPPLLELRAISKRFIKTLDAAEKVARIFGAHVREHVVHAVDGVDLAVEQGEVVGLVGESGCGKSTLGRIAAGLLAPSAGRRLWRGEEVSHAPGPARRRVQLAAQMIFQDPHGSLNPRMRVQDIVGEAPLVHGIVGREEMPDYVASILARVGLDGGVMRRFPHQFSGGQRARIGIARALAVKPEFLVCDEAVAALDVSIQAQVLNLFIRLREELALTYLFISHDLGVVRHVSDRVVIMYLGRVVETGPTEALYEAPNHPYTRALLAEIPRLDARHRTFTPVRGEIPSPLAPPSGCHFHPRCPHAMPRCAAERPALREIAPGRWSACHLNDEPGDPPGDDLGGDLGNPAPRK
jgi:peptide/nickel transport system ATP-binding protein